MFTNTLLKNIFGSYSDSCITHLLSALLTLFLWWFAGYLIEKSLKKLVARGHSDTLLSFLGSIARKSLLGLGIIFTAGQLGFDITGILAGLGVTGFALGFAFKDALSNMIAGIFLLFYRPFTIGDTIKIETNKVLYEGRVTAIDLRYTTLHGANETILIPNAFLLIEPIAIAR